jgi:predicted short-subunit dehydrogenase-like oxidoreductase (DUF2520 family)
MLPRSIVRTISIIGAGRVGATLGRGLLGQGWRIGAVVTRSKATSHAAVRKIGAGSAHSKINRELVVADLIVIATPDDALGAVAKSLARVAGKALQGKIVLHTSGALDRDVLAPLARQGASTGSLHPMQTFSGHGAPKLVGVVFAIEGDAKARRAAVEIARTLGGVPVTIDGRDKPAYHAAGVLAAGHALALLESAVEVLIGIGFTRRHALDTLLPLTRQMLDNMERLGPRASWTGPVARGDYATIAKHANALRRYPREFRQAYAALALLATRVLAKRPSKNLGQLKRALKNSMGGSR